MSVKIFCIYHKPYEVYKSDAVITFQTGCSYTDLDLSFLKDNTGINIGDKNKNYAEMTAWYWVWENYLNENPDLEYIGFCHYRRFLDFEKPENRKPFSNKIDCKKFSKDFNKKYSQEKIYNQIKDYDIILPSKNVFKKKSSSIYKQFINNHPQEDLDNLIKIVKENYPEFSQDVDDYFNGRTSYFCLNFVIKKELFVEFLTWTFDILDKLEKVSDWSKYTDYSNIRMPAYLIERFYNVWIMHKIRTSNIKVLERKSILLCDFHFQITELFSISKNNNVIEIKFLFLRFSIKEK